MSGGYYRYDNVGCTVVCSQYDVAKQTPKGVRLVCGKLILHAHIKRFAYPTVEEAKTAFLARKRRQLAIVKVQIADIEQILGRPDPFENGPDEFAVVDFADFLA